MIAPALTQAVQIAGPRFKCIITEVTKSLLKNEMKTIRNFSGRLKLKNKNPSVGADLVPLTGWNLR